MEKASHPQGNPPCLRTPVPNSWPIELWATGRKEYLAAAFASALPELKVAQYGSTDRIAAGHPEFKGRYLAGIEETRQFGKRPDLLFFPDGTPVDADLSERSYADTEPLLNDALAAVEVRSSKFDALRYIAVRKRQRDSGKSTGRETPSFTVKVEDLVIVYRWLERHRVPQSYCQVFFDSVFAIDFLDIFATIASGSGFTVEKPKKSQEKSTIMIPITRGAQIGRATAVPTFAAEHRVTELGRHDAYVVPQGGGFELDAAATKNLLLAES